MAAGAGRARGPRAALGGRAGRSRAKAGAHRRHRHQRQDHDHVPRRRRAARRRPQGRPRGHRAIPHRRPPGRRHPHHAGVVRPPGHVPRDGGRRLLARGDRGLLAFARAAARRGQLFPGGRVHQPHARPPGLPRRHGDVLPGQADALLGPAASRRARGDQRRRRSRGRAREGLARTRVDVRPRAARGLPGRRRGPRPGRHALPRA